jgi:hypothetical protein
VQLIRSREVLRLEASFGKGHSVKTFAGAADVYADNRGVFRVGRPGEACVEGRCLFFDIVFQKIIPAG